MKNLTKCYILNIFALKNNGKFAEHNLEKLCPWFLAPSVLVLGLKRVCHRKVGPWSWIFFEFLASKVVCSTIPLLIFYFIVLRRVPEIIYYQILFLSW